MSVPVPNHVTLAPKTADAIPEVSLRTRLGLNAANFFLAEVLGVVMPFLAKFLAERGWRDDAIGVAACVTGLGVFLMQTPAGLLVDRIRQRRVLLAGASVALGVCYGVLPLLPSHWIVVDSLVFFAGVSHAFFTPLLGALALGIVGHAALNRVIGVNQSWNHAGNIAAALTAMFLVSTLGFGSAAVFYAVFAVSVLAAASVLLIRPEEVDEERASGRAKHQQGKDKPVGVWQLLRDRRVCVLFAATALFHLANAPVMPLVGLYIARLDGTDTQVAAVVLVAQTIMVPVSLAAGWLCGHWGRKPVFAIGFVVLPLRIFLYSLTDQPWELVALQALDGIGAGIYGVVIVSICADLTRQQGGFNTLQGLIATALSIGGVIGPLCAGFIVQHLGFNMAFYTFATIAALGAVLFIGLMPETGKETSSASVAPQTEPISTDRSLPVPATEGGSI